MSIYWDKNEQRYRFSFNRKIGVGLHKRRVRATKLLPKGWSKRQAELYDQKTSKDLYAQASGVAPKELSLAHAVQLYIDNRCPRLADGGTKYIQELAKLFDFIKGASLDQVNDVADKYRKAHPKLSDATLRNRLSYLKAAVRYAFKKHKYGTRDYTSGMDLPVPDNQRQVYARVPELNRLWRAFDDKETRALFKLVFYLGLRWRAELLTREPQHIVRNGADVWLEIGKTKNGQPVMKYVHAEVRACLKFIPFAHADTYYYDRWKVAAAKIGRPDMHPHDLRHSLASEIISRPGASLDDVRAALHHKSLQAANRYSHRYPEVQKRILAATGGAKKMHSPKLVLVKGKTGTDD
jgi:integrase